MAKKSKNKYVKDKSYVHPLPISLYTFFTRITSLFTYLSFYNHKSSKPQGIFDSLSNSVIVCDKRDIEKLWKQGFFGKGNLSRSEPTWNNRRNLTAEQVTQKRRLFRAKRKLKKQKRSIVLDEDKDVSISTSKNNDNSSFIDIPPDITSNTVDTVENSKETIDINDMDKKSDENKWIISIKENNKCDKCDNAIKDNKCDKCDNASEDNISNNYEIKSKRKEKGEEEDELIMIKDEHLQLTAEEAFFLGFGIGALDIYDSNNNLMSIQECWDEFRISSISCSSQINILGTNNFHQQKKMSINNLDNPFIIKYIAYHHFRSLGWVVKSGIKFGVDYALYEKGPVFKHAEYGVVVLPYYPSSKDNNYNNNNSQFRQNVVSSWQLLMNLSRVCVQIKKSLILCYVIIPYLNSSRSEEEEEEEENTSENISRGNTSVKNDNIDTVNSVNDDDILVSHNLLNNPMECLRNYKIKEILVNRCIPEKLK
ncbi:hypothetical protein Glove_452g17 [Diversispora epigaea]|uniref:tRNA-splicing endonuclease subunit Sen2 n=1 Tax=Diversispora epigaea TaxID=1348612 RepID=A0A397GTN4_9GLOM|nr:hypothetical protein Glove_452g17 [Diversispora epigaea]